MIFHYDKGIKIIGSQLWLDAHRSVEFCCVSHAHLDHAKKHGKVIATPETLFFLNQRIGKTGSVKLGYEEPCEFEGCKVTLFPAGHILGSAQTLVEVNGLRLLYSGDFNMRESAAAEPIIIPESDILIMECTFGKPIYKFPSRKQIEEQLISFVEKSIEDGFVPVVIGYVLGKSQEAMKILGDAGFEMSVHGSIARLAKTYEAFGIKLGKWDRYKKDELEGKVVVAPRTALKTRMLKNIARKRTVFLSGWAIHNGAKKRYGVDEILPLSDHADFAGLLEYIRQVKPKKIYTTHGPRAFAFYLRQLGYNAEPLQPAKQLELF